MDPQHIVDVVGELVVDDGETLGKQRGSRALKLAREMETTLTPHLDENPKYAAIWRNFRSDPEGEAAFLVAAVDRLLQADAALARRLDALLQQYHRATQSAGRDIRTSGGAYVSGDVSVRGGDFVGRDKTTMIGDANVVGDRSSSTVIKRTGVRADEVAALFDQALGLASQKPPAVRDDLEAAVETVQEESEVGEDADKRLLNKALDVLLEEGPDVLEIVLEAVLNPAAAAGKGARMLARQAKKALAKKRGGNIG